MPLRPDHLNRERQSRLAQTGINRGSWQLRKVRPGGEVGLIGRHVSGEVEGLLRGGRRDDEINFVPDSLCRCMNIANVLIRRLDLLG